MKLAGIPLVVTRGTGKWTAPPKPFLPQSPMHALAALPRNLMGDQCKCMQILHGIPAKILNRARDFFTKKMVVSATGHGGPSVGGPGAQASCLIENASVDSTKSITSNDEKSKEAVHLVSKERSQEGSNVKQYCNMACGEKPRSYSLRLGTIGRIDEERPCSFKEREGMAANLCPRSRSVAIMRAPVN